MIFPEKLDGILKHNQGFKALRNIEAEAKI